MKTNCKKDLGYDPGIFYNLKKPMSETNDGK